MQGDLIYDIRCPFWDNQSECYSKGYTNAIILTNTCDISADNSRSVNPKECILAPLIDLQDQIEILQERNINKSQIQTFVTSIRSQEITNIFYLPHTPGNGREYIAILDKIFWVNTSEINALLKTLKEDRIGTLNLYGFYLFLLKLSHHICRFPEDNDRP